MISSTLLGHHVLDMDTINVACHFIKLIKASPLVGVFSKYIRYSKVGEGRVREFLISEIATIITHGVGIKLAQLIKIQQGSPQIVFY